MTRRSLIGFGWLVLWSGFTAPGLSGQVGPSGVRLAATYPPADTLSQGDVKEVRLRFSEPVQPTLTAVSVLGPGGSIPPTGPADTVAGSNGTEVSFHFGAPLPDGTYTLEWRTAGLDGAVVRGSYGFSVTRPVSAPGSGPDSGSAGAGAATEGPAPGRAPEREFGPGGLAMNWIFLLSIVGMIGTVAFRLGVAAPLGRREDLVEMSERISRRLVRLAWLFAAFGIISVPVRLAYEVSVAAGPGREVSVAGLFGSTWGSAWLLELASVALFLVALLLMGRDSRLWPWILALVAALIASVVPGLSGHALSGGVSIVTVNTLHVVAAGTWAGGLACLVLVGIPAAAVAPPESSALSAVAAAFSRMALPAVTLLVISGVVNATHDVTWGQLLTTSYGRLLSVKLLFVVGAFALGFYNWRMVRPALEGQPRSGLLSVPATLELVVALCVLAVTAGLIITARP